jgi:hypothetical protein
MKSADYRPGDQADAAPWQEEEWLQPFFLAVIFHNRTGIRIFLPPRQQFKALFAGAL